MGGGDYHMTVQTEMNIKQWQTTPPHLLEDRIIRMYCMCTRVRPASGGARIRADTASSAEIESIAL